MNYPNWNEIACSTPNEKLNFKANDYQELLIHFYREIILNRDRDNEEVVSIWLNYCDERRNVKDEFFEWINDGGFDVDNDVTIQWKHVLRFLNYMSQFYSLIKLPDMGV